MAVWAGKADCEWVSRRQVSGGLSLAVFAVRFVRWAPSSGTPFVDYGI